MQSVEVIFVWSGSVRNSMTSDSINTNRGIYAPYGPPVKGYQIIINHKKSNDYIIRLYNMAILLYSHIIGKFIK